MFNRKRQWVTEAELDADLPVLLGEPSNQQHFPSGLRAELTAAEVVIGRFFFVHEAQATRDDTQLKTFEFLHTTFGEYLIARLVTLELDELAETAERGTTRSRSAPLNDTFMHALLSFAPLTMRATIVSFIIERLQILPKTRRELLREVLLALFHRSLFPRHDTSYDSYEPDRIFVPARHAAYSANLVLLTVLIAGEITGRQLFPDSVDPVYDWRKITLLWASQLPKEGWNNLIHTVRLDRNWDNGRRVFRLKLRNAADQGATHCDLYWTYNEYPQPGVEFGWTTEHHEIIRKQIDFVCDTGVDSLAHALEPFWNDELGRMVTTFHDVGQGRPASAANALIKLWLAANKEKNPNELATVYDTCLRIATSDLALFDVDTRACFRRLFLCQLAANQRRLPPGWVHDAIRKINEVDRLATDEEPEPLRMAEEILGEPMAE